jgi:hypothetical protein
MNKKCERFRKMWGGIYRDLRQRERERERGSKKGLRKLQNEELCNV